MQKTTSLGHAEAQTAIETIKNELIKRGKTAVIAVGDPHGELIALLRVDGAPFTSIIIAANKVYTAAREKMPSRLIGELSRDPDSGFDMAFYGDPKILGWGGGLPVVVGGEVVGAVAVSGLQEMEDIELAQLGVDSITASQHPE